MMEQPYKTPPRPESINQKHLHRVWETNIKVSKIRKPQICHQCQCYIDSGSKVWTEKDDCTYAMSYRYYVTRYYCNDCKPVTP